MHFFHNIPVKCSLWTFLEVGGSFLGVYIVEPFLPNLPRFVCSHTSIL
jgi:hypothetical protein